MEFPQYREAVVEVVDDQGDKADVDGVVRQPVQGCVRVGWPGCPARTIAFARCAFPCSMCPTRAASDLVSLNAVIPGSSRKILLTCENAVAGLCPRQDSNLRHPL